MTREEAIKSLEYMRLLLVSQDWGEALHMAISALREQESANSCKKCNSWIPVTERLPEKCTIVLCYKDGQRRLGHYLGANYSEGVAAFRHPKDQWAFGVTHWMPLPEPPTEEEV